MRAVFVSLFRRPAAILAAVLVSVCGCDRLAAPTPVSPGPEPAFLWGVTNPAAPGEVADLAGDNPFLVRLDSPFTGGVPTLRSVRRIRDLTVHPEIRFMIVLPYRPDAAATPEAWTAFVTRAVRYYGRQPHVRYLQITQGINSPSYMDFAGNRAPFARQALLEGLRAARAERDRTGADIRIGFSVYAGTGTAPTELLRWLGLARDLPDLIDWVGIDCYPGSGIITRERGAGDALRTVLHRARVEWLPAAGLAEVPLHVTQLGVATVLQVSPEAQARWIDTLTRTVWDAREELDIRACCWYETRDKDSTATLLAGPRRYVAAHFGLSTSTGWRKLGWAMYRNRVAQYQAQTPRSPMVD